MFAPPTGEKIALTEGPKDKGPAVVAGPLDRLLTLSLW